MSGRAPHRSADGWRHGFLKRGPAAGPLVVKFGGSLLGRPDWPDLLRSLVCSLPAFPVAVVVGGGAIVNSIRRIDAAAEFEPSVSHRLAIDAMAITARRVSEALGWPLLAALPETLDPHVLDVPTWLHEAGRLDRLPAGWDVTSDSIAAVVAADRSRNLLLAKSIPPPDVSASLDRMAAAVTAGWIDAWFPVPSEGVPTIEWAAPLDEIPD